MPDQSHNISTSTDSDMPVMNFTKEELESWLRQEYEKRPLNNAPLPGEVTTRQIIEILGVSDDIGKRFIKSLVATGNATMKKAGNQCFYKLNIELPQYK